MSISTMALLRNQNITDLVHTYRQRENSIPLHKHNLQGGGGGSGGRGVGGGGGEGV